MGHVTLLDALTKRCALQAAFLLPSIHGILSRGVEPPEYGQTILPHCVIVAPTRELVSQIHIQAKKFSNGTDVHAQVVYGGTHVMTQLTRLRNGCELLVGTPGRLLHFLTKGEVRNRYYSLACQSTK